jgi:dGTPase
LFALDDLRGLPLIGRSLEAVDKQYPGLERTRLINESLRRFISGMVNDVIAESVRRFRALKPGDAAGVRALKGAVVGFSATMQDHDKILKQFLFAHMYRHTTVNRMTSKARRVVRDLFGLLLAEPELLPEDWRGEGIESGTLKAARRVADYIAGMTDRFALDEHSRLFDPAVKP